MDEYIMKKDALNIVQSLVDCDYDIHSAIYDACNSIKSLPSAELEQIKMIKEIRKWINSGNRGSADYFIVDKIEEIINKYE